MEHTVHLPIILHTIAPNLSSLRGQLTTPPLLYSCSNLPTPLLIGGAGTRDRDANISLADVKMVLKLNRIRSK